MAWLTEEGNYYWLMEKVKDPVTGKWKNRPKSTGIRVNPMGKVAAGKYLADYNEDRARMRVGLQPLHKEAARREAWWSILKPKMLSHARVSLGAHGQKKALFLLEVFEKLFNPDDISLDEFKRMSAGNLYAEKRLAGLPATRWCGSKKLVNRPIMVSTLRTELSYLSPLFEKAADDWSEETGLTKNPFKRVRIATTISGVKKKKDDPKYMPFEQILEFFAECRRRHGPYGEFMMKVFYYTGVRLNEGQKLRVEAVDLVNGRVGVPGTKTAKADRFVDFPVAFLPEVEAYVRMAGPGFLLRHKNMGMMPASTIQHRVKKAFKAIGLPWAHVHTLRHCYTSHRLDNGDNLMDVRDAVGHGNIATTNIYAHRGAKRQQITLGAAPTQAA